VEVVRDLYYRRIVPAWLAFAGAVANFLDEAAHRVALAFDVLVGRMPQRVEKRWWSRSAETPLLIDCFDWTSERLLFSVIVWPPLESPPESADDDMRERTEQVLDAIAKGASERMWSTRWEVDYGLRWDHKREVWVGSDGYAYAPPVRTGDAA
jgi:hypothetical protein